MLPLFSQSANNNDGNFLKRIEYNRRVFEFAYNIDSKTDVEKRFWGNFNAPVEFFYSPSLKEKDSGFRVLKDSLNTWTLEVKFIMNSEEIQKKSYEKYSVRTLSSSEMASMPKDSLDLISALNTENIQKALKEQNKLSNIDSRSFLISNQFAEILYKKMISVIENYKGKGIAPLIDDGYVVTFRTVVDDEIWSLIIHCPQGGGALKMSNICKQIVADANKSKLDEASYIKLLDDL